MDYFRQRDGPMAKDGISALKKSLAAIYYLPFQCGVNLYFRFSGLCAWRCAALSHDYFLKCPSTWVQIVRLLFTYLSVSYSRGRSHSKQKHRHTICIVTFKALKGSD